MVMLYMWTCLICVLAYMAFELLLWHIFGWIHSATIEGFTFARGYCHRNPALHKEGLGRYSPTIFFKDIPLYRISGKTPSQVSLKLFPHSEIPPGITSHSISVGVFPHNISQNILPRTVSLWKYSLTVYLCNSANIPSLCKTPFHSIVWKGLPRIICFPVFPQYISPVKFSGISLKTWNNTQAIYFIFPLKRKPL